MVLTGTEIKSIRESKASITESFCEFNERGELFAVNMYIEEYLLWNPLQPQTAIYLENLLLNKKELRKLNKQVKNVGLNNRST